MTIPNEPDAKLSYMNRLVLVFHRKKSDLYLAQQLGNKTIFYSGKKKKKALLFLVLWPPQGTFTQCHIKFAPLSQLTLICFPIDVYLYIYVSSHKRQEERNRGHRKRYTTSKRGPGKHQHLSRTRDLVRWHRNFIWKLR